MPLNDWHAEISASRGLQTVSVTRLREVVPYEVLLLRAPTIEMIVPMDGVVEVTGCDTGVKLFFSTVQVLGAIRRRLVGVLLSRVLNCDRLDSCTKHRFRFIFSFKLSPAMLAKEMLSKTARGLVKLFAVPIAGICMSGSDFGGASRLESATVENA